jgi:hypothetical protein
MILLHDDNDVIDFVQISICTRWLRGKRACQRGN